MMKNQIRKLATPLVVVLVLITVVGMFPRTVLAQDNRQQTKNNWRNLAIAAAGASAFGFIKNDPRIGFIGAAGALYSLNRYEQDRKSQSAASRARASIFSKPYFYRNGQRYERRLVKRHGKKYYRFVRT